MTPRSAWQLRWAEILTSISSNRFSSKILNWARRSLYDKGAGGGGGGGGAGGGGAGVSAICDVKSREYYAFKRILVWSRAQAAQSCRWLCVHEVR
jgi:hypothetical protein